ncbi:MAG: SH3 domain-containing protein [Clostridiales bacterium]|nr:SH3 domain-containing protein [Clostridiales bacterium]
MRNKTRWKKRVFALAMTAALSVTGITAGPVVTAWAIPASGTAVADNIVVRNSAVSGDQVDGLSEGQAVSIVDETTGSDGNTWYQISYTVDGGERSGWVRGDLLETSDESLAETSNESTEEDSGTDESEAEAEESVSLEFATQNGSITLTDIPEEELSLVSGHFVETSLEFAEGAITALQLAEPDELVADDAAIVDFYYVYGYNEIGESGWYVYNADDGTIQKNLLNMQYSVTETEEDETEAASDFSEDSLTKMAFSVLAVIGLLLLILTIIFSVRYRRLRRILEEELEEEEEEAPKRIAAEPKQKNSSEERGGVKTKKEKEKPEPVKVRKGSAQPASEEKKDRRQAEIAEPDAKRTAEESAADHAGEAAGNHREKASSAKKNKKKNAPVQEAPVTEPVSEIGGVDVLDLDFMDDTDFEALLNRYIEEDLASGTNEAAESAGIPDAPPMPETGTQEADTAWEDFPPEDAVKKESGSAQRTPGAREEKPEWLDDYDIPLEKGADYDIPASDESDSMDLSKLKMPDEEPEYYDDDDDLEFL